MLLFRLPVIYFLCSRYRKTWKHFRYIVKLTCTCCEPYDMIENKLLVKIKHMKSIGKSCNIDSLSSFSFAIDVLAFISSFLLCSLCISYSLLFYPIAVASRKCCCLNNGTNRFMLSLFSSCMCVFVRGNTSERLFGSYFFHSFFFLSASCCELQ